MTLSERISVLTAVEIAEEEDCDDDDGRTMDADKDRRICVGVVDLVTFFVSTQATSQSTSFPGGRTLGCKLFIKVFDTRDGGTSFLASKDSELQDPTTGDADITGSKCLGESIASFNIRK